jgi:hypothetical protein
MWFFDAKAGFELALELPICSEAVPILLRFFRALTDELLFSEM